jgi:hypothetical protein
LFFLRIFVFLKKPLKLELRPCSLSSFVVDGVTIFLVFCYIFGVLLSAFFFFLLLVVFCYLFCAVLVTVSLHLNELIC